MLWRDRLDVLLAGPGPRMVFQPIVRLEDMRRIGWEALARFPDSAAVQAVESDIDRATLIGLLDESGEGWSPQVWFAAAADEGRTIDLEIACVRAALKRLVDVPQGEYLSLNVGPSTALSPRLVDALCGHDLSRVVLELTEHIAIRDYAPFRALAANLRDRRGGACVRVPAFAADDVGAGAASLAHVFELRSLLDLVKLDMALVKGVETDPMRQVIIAGIVTAGRQPPAHYGVVAEGATLAQIPTLARLGVHAVQGFELGMPGPLST